MVARQMLTVMAGSILKIENGLTFEPLGQQSS